MKSIFAFVLTLLALAVAGQSKESYTKVYDSLMVVGQYDELTAYLEKELNISPKNEELLRSIGYVHLAKNNLDTGEKYYLEALAVNPQCAMCYVNLGKAQAQRGDNKKALEHFNTAVALEPKNAELLSNRAMLKAYIGDKFGALRDHDKAIEMDPQNAVLYFYRGQYNGNSGYQALALLDYSKAIELNPKLHQPYFERASLLFTQKRYDEALTDINQAIALDNNQHTFYNGRAAIYYALQAYEQALDDYSKAALLNPTDFYTHKYKADCAYQLEDMEAYCNEYTILQQLIQTGQFTDETAIKSVREEFEDICDPNRASHYYQRGIAYYNRGEFQKAIDMYNDGLLAFPNHSMTLIFKGNAQMAQAEYTAAVSSYLLALEYKDNLLNEIKSNYKIASTSLEAIDKYYAELMASTYFSLAECLTYEDQLDAALTAINQALAIKTNSELIDKAAFYNLKGHVHMMQGQLELAIAEFNQSIAINANFPLAYVNRAVAKVSLAEKIKISAYSLGLQINQQPIPIHWNLPKKSSAKKSDTSHYEALADCNKALALTKELAFAYYVRGHVKLLLQQSDACLDFVTAKSMGMMVEPEVLKSCGE